MAHASRRPLEMNGNGNGNGYGQEESSTTDSPSHPFLQNHRGSVGSSTPPYIQLATIPEGSPSLQRDPFSTSAPRPLFSRKRRQQTASYLHQLTSRLPHLPWRPTLLIALPFALVIIYAIVESRVPALPSLPQISISTAGGKAIDLRPINERCLCGATDEGERVCKVYGDGLGRSRLFEGSGARVKRMLAKAKMGIPLKVGILGGSVSACHGVHPNVEYPQGDPRGPGCWTTLVKDYLDHTFPLRKGQEHELMNGAIGGMDSSYYAFCGTHHIPKDVDMILLEFDVNDQASKHYQTFFDQLVRIVLELPSAPSVVILGSWAPAVAQDQGYGDPQLAHLPISHYYDVPYISMKRMLFNHYLRWPHETATAFWQGDKLHPNARGHRILGDLVISYLDSQLCELALVGPSSTLPVEETVQTTNPFSSLVNISFPFDTAKLKDPANPPEGWEASFDSEKLALLANEQRIFVGPITPYSVPLTTVFQPLRDVVNPDEADPSNAGHILSLVQPKAFCADANDKENPMKPSSSEGWREYNWQGEKHYWVSEQVGARIKVDIKVNQGRIAVYYFQSQHYDLGDAKCWVDDNERGAVRLPGWWSRPYNVASVAYIDEKVTPGDHYVTCEILNETTNPSNPDAHHFRITAVMAT